MELGYPCVYVMFKFKIIYYLMRMYGISLAKANRIWENGYDFDPRIYRVMKFFIEREHPKVVINRNPTLNYYSIILMNIRNVTPGRSYTMSVPLSVLPGLNADFDGDILNIIGIMDDVVAKMFRKFNPTRYMITSRDTGLLNDYFNITKGQKNDILEFCTYKPKEEVTSSSYTVKDRKKAVSKILKGIYKEKDGKAAKA